MTTWEELSVAEKVEDLRRDVKRIFDLLNGLSTRIDNLAMSGGATKTKVDEVGRAVQALEKRLPKD